MIESSKEKTEHPTATTSAVALEMIKDWKEKNTGSAKNLLRQSGSAKNLLRQSELPNDLERHWKEYMGRNLHLLKSKVNTV